MKINGRVWILAVLLLVASALAGCEKKRERPKEEGTGY